jgi:hypothetical protein
MAGEKRLWFEETLVLDDATSSDANVWTLSPQRYLRFGNALQAYFAVDYSAVGPGVDSGEVTMSFERSAAQTDADSAFEAMNLSSFALSRRTDTLGYVFGEDGAENTYYPRGVGRVKVTNSDTTPEAWAAVHLRVWATLQEA